MSENILAALSEIISEWFNAFMENLPNLVGGLLVIVVSIYLGRLLARLVAEGLRRSAKDPEVTLLLQRLVRWGVITLGIVIALQLTGQDVSALLTGLGVLGFTLGFALQEISANFVSGILLLVQQPFEINDVIEVGSFIGRVMDIDLRSTQLLTLDGRYVLIPNNDVLNSPIINYGRTQSRRAELVVGVGYDSNLEQARQLTFDTLKDLPGLSQEVEQPIEMYFEKFGGSSIDARIFVWFDVNQTNPAAVKDWAIMAIKPAYEAAGIDIPFPIQTVYMNRE